MADYVTSASTQAGSARLPSAVAHDAGAAFMLYAQALLPVLLPLGVLLFEPTAKRRHRMLPFTVLGIALGLYVLWALAAFPTQVSLEKNSIVYMNPATHHGLVALLYVVATCGSLFFSKVKDMVVFGVANLLILLITMAVREYAFTSIWCAYAAIASVIIWFGFRHSSRARPFQYTEAIEPNASPLPKNSATASRQDRNASLANFARASMPTPSATGEVCWAGVEPIRRMREHLTRVHPIAHNLNASLTVLVG